MHWSGLPRGTLVPSRGGRPLNASVRSSNINPGRLPLKNIVPIALCTLMAACVPAYTVQDGKPTAELNVEVTTESTGTVGTFFMVLTFEDPDCSGPKEGSRLLQIKSTGAKDVGGPVRVVAGEPITLAIKTMEGRLGESRQCSFTTTFTPSVAQSYTVQFASLNQAQACNMRVLDAAGTQIAQKDPIKSCAKPHPLGPAPENGVGTRDFGW